MYYYLNGILAHCEPTLAVIDCGGVGYKCFITEMTYRKISKMEKVKLLTYLNVKEDTLDLYGFADEQEQQLFIRLISVSGVGPKVALSLLSTFLPEEFAACVITSDIKKLTKAAGVGTKMAQRICLELKDKIAKLSEDMADFANSDGGFESIGSDLISESIAVLVALGYNKNDAVQALRKCSADNTNDLVRQSLRVLSKHL